jgi:RNA polymerase sigma-70 factor (sigma-E family)
MAVANVDGVMESTAVSGRDEERVAGRGVASTAALPAERWSAFGEFYAAEYPRMVRVALLVTGSSETAQDVVQDSFVGVWRRWDQLRDPAGYLYRSVVNGCRSHHRRATREQKVRALTGLDRPGASFAPAGTDELSDALASLPHRQRVALVLRFYDDLSEGDAAAVLGCRPGTIGSLVHRGLAQLKRVIEL